VGNEISEKVERNDPRADRSNDRGQYRHLSIH
jgi:hypothetical protein